MAFGRGIRVDLCLRNGCYRRWRKAIDEFLDEYRRDRRVEIHVVQVFLQLIVNLLQQFEPLGPVLADEKRGPTIGKLVREFLDRATRAN